MLREIIRVRFLSVLLLIFSFAISSQAFAAETYKIGCVSSLTGAYAMLGVPVKQGIELAIKHQGGTILGRKIELVVEDCEGQPQVAVQKTNKLISGGADLIAGAVNSSSTLAMMEILKRNKIPHLSILSADDRITGGNKSRYTFRTSQPYLAESKMVALFVKDSKIKKLYGVVADYGVMRQTWDRTVTALKAKGGEVAGADYPAIGTVDFSVIINKIADSKADAVAVYLAGRDFMTFITQIGQQGVRENVILFSMNAPVEVAADAIGPASIGFMGSLRWHSSMDNNESKIYDRDFRKEFNVAPSFMDADSYDGLRMWFKHMEEQKTFDKEKLVSTFENFVYKNSIKGVKTMRSCSHQAAQVGLWGSIVEAKPAPAPGSNNPKYVFKVLKVFDADQLYDTCDKAS